MGLKDVLSKMRLVEIDELDDPRGPKAPGPASPLAGFDAVGLPAGSSRPGPAGPPGSMSSMRSPSPTGPAGSAGPGSDKRPGRPGSESPAAPSPLLGEFLDKLPDPPEIDEKALSATAEKGAKVAKDPDPAGQPGAPTAPDTDGIPDFAAIYRAAGITNPPHGYSALKVHEILSSADFAGLEPRAKAAALSGFLKMNPSGPVAITDVIQDAVRRDQALDKFEELMRGKLAARADQVERDNGALQAEIDELTRRNRAKMEGNRRDLEGEQGRLARWRAAKRVEEQRLADSVAPFVDHNPITTGPVEALDAGRASAPPAPGHRPEPIALADPAIDPTGSGRQGPQEASGRPAPSRRLR